MTCPALPAIFSPTGRPVSAHPEELAHSGSVTLPEGPRPEAYARLAVALTDTVEHESVSARRL